MPSRRDSLREGVGSPTAAAICRGWYSQSQLIKFFTDRQGVPRQFFENTCGQINPPAWLDTKSVAFSSDNESPDRNGSRVGRPFVSA